MDYEKEIIERLTRIEESQRNILQRIDTLTKQIERTSTAVFDHEKRIGQLEFVLNDHLKDDNRQKKTMMWRYSLVIPLLVSGAVALVDVLMRMLGY